MTSWYHMAQVAQSVASAKHARKMHELRMGFVVNEHGNAVPHQMGVDYAVDTKRAEGKQQSEEELRQWEAGKQQGVVDHHQTGWQRLLSRVTGAARTT